MKSWLVSLAVLWAVAVKAQEPGIVPFEVAIEALSAEDAATRAAAVRELAFQDRPEALPPLLTRLSTPEPDPWVRKEIYAALGALGLPEATPTLTSCLTVEERSELQGECIASLGLLQADAALPAIVDLAQAGTASPLLRLRALDALGRFEAAATLPVLVQALGDPGREVRLHALAALGVQAAPQAFDPVLAFLAEPRDEDEASAALLVLGRLRDARALSTLQRYLAPAQPLGLRLAAARALVGLPGEAVTQAMTEPLAAAPPALQRELVDGLAARGDRAAAAALAALLDERLLDYLAAETTALLQPEAAWLERLDLMTAIAQALTALDRPPLPGPILAVIEGRALPSASAPAAALADADYRLRAALLLWLGGADDAALAAFLRDFVAQEGGDLRLRAAAARSLGRLARLDPVASRAALEALLSDARRELRWSATQGLLLAGDPAAIPALQGVAAVDPDPLVRRAAAEAAAALAN